MILILILVSAFPCTHVEVCEFSYWCSRVSERTSADLLVGHWSGRRSRRAPGGGPLDGARSGAHTRAELTVEAVGILLLCVAFSAPARRGAHRTRLARRLVLRVPTGRDVVPVRREVAVRLRVDQLELALRLCVQLEPESIFGKSSWRRVRSLRRNALALLGRVDPVVVGAQRHTAARHPRRLHPLVFIELLLHATNDNENSFIRFSYL